MPLIMSRRLVNGSRISSSSSITARQQSSETTDLSQIVNDIQQLEVRVEALESTPVSNVTYIEETW